MKKIVNKKNNGITLIALVITIIILLILAGITIAQLTGSGLFDKAKQAKNASTNSEVYENQVLNDYENIIDNILGNKYTIIFDANGGEGTMNSISMTYDVEQQLPVNTFTRSGYSFLGWSTNKDATTAEFTDGQSILNLISKDER